MNVFKNGLSSKLKFHNDNLKPYLIIDAIIYGPKIIPKEPPIIEKTSY